jgi:hypothetical protein
MDNVLAAVADARGFVTRPEVLDCGYDDQLIREALRSGEWVTIGPGLYADGAPYRAMRAEDQHIVRCRAVLHRHGDSVVLTHQSGALAHEIPVWGVDLRLVNITRLDKGRGRHEAGVFHHLGSIDESDIEEINGLRVVKAARAVWETACIGSIEAGLVTADAALHLNIVTSEELAAAAARFNNWQGSRSARLTLKLADERSGSPGESRSRHLFWRFGLPTPELQYTVKNAFGRVIAYTDFGWPEYCHVAEFDGRVKYDGSLGTDGTRALVAEKAREDDVRGQSLGMSRLVWRELDPPFAAQTARRVWHDMEQSRRLYARNRTVIA